MGPDRCPSESLCSYNREQMNPWDAFSALIHFIAGLPAIVLIGVGVPLLLVGAEWLVRGSVTLARRFGISTLIIGLTIVAAGTSAPELVINIMAATAGNPGLSFGNVIGSNIANIGLIVGIGALITPMVVHHRVVRSELPWLMGISIAMVCFALPIARMGFTSGYGRVEGIGFIVGFFLLLGLWYRAARSRSNAPVQELVEKADEQADSSIPIAATLFVIGLVTLLIGGRLTELGAVKVATALGLSHAVIGMTVLAVATSLPELITVIVACRRGHTDLAVGNIVGSNLFNILLVMGVTATIATVPVPGAAGWQDLGAMLVFSALLWWFCVTHNQRVQRWEGAVLLGLYAGYIAWSVVREMAPLAQSPATG